MQAAVRTYLEEVRRTHGLELDIHLGLNASKVVVHAFITAKASLLPARAATEAPCQPPVASSTMSAGFR
jgi:hypothetical protein